MHLWNHNAWAHNMFICSSIYPQSRMQALLWLFRLLLPCYCLTTALLKVVLLLLPNYWHTTKLLRPAARAKASKQRDTTTIRIIAYSVSYSVQCESYTIIERRLVQHDRISSMDLMAMCGPLRTKSDNTYALRNNKLLPFQRHRTSIIHMWFANAPRHDTRHTL